MSFVFLGVPVVSIVVPFLGLPAYIYIYIYMYVYIYIYIQGPIK